MKMLLLCTTVALALAGCNASATDSTENQMFEAKQDTRACWQHPQKTVPDCIVFKKGERMVLVPYSSPDKPCVRRVGDLDKNCFFVSPSDVAGPSVGTDEPGTVVAKQARERATPESAANGLPECRSSDVKQTFEKVANPWETFEIKEYRPTDDGKRWCYAFFIGRGPGLRSPYMQAVFTLEWVNKSSGEYWLQVRTSDLTCRGVMGNPMSTERCG